MDKEQLDKILADHAEWLSTDGASGERADLTGANLYGANLTGADLRRANLYEADLRRANLRRANLYGANLTEADLGSANLTDVDLRGTNLWDCVGNRKNIKSIFVSEDYAIVYTSEYLQIGCECHLISEWAEFDDSRIIQMDGKRALKFWREWKEVVFMLIKKSPAEPTGYVEENK